jgi:predicted ATP-binding protein involved in virulence
MRKIANQRYEKERVAGHYFLELCVDNVRCFGGKQCLRFADDAGKPHHWTIILGENGTGKTSLLKALVAIAPSPKSVSAENQNIRLYPGLYDWQQEWDMRRIASKSTPTLRAVTVAGHKISRPIAKSELHLTLSQNTFDSPQIVASSETYSLLGNFLCFAYGASRRMSRAGFAKEREERASASLFNDDASLVNVEDFFMQADYEAKTSKSKRSIEQRENVRRLLIDILPDVTDLRIGKSIRNSSRIARQVEARTSFGWVHLSELSLGYKSLIAWMVDFASRMYYHHETKENPFEAPAVVLIDEIDLHMHPTWQRKILRYLSRRFPNTQFIATAHSPLIVQAAANANLVLLKRQGSKVKISAAPEMVKEWRIDQILTSDLFGLTSSRSESAERLLAERRRLLMTSNPSPQDTQKIERIESRLSSIPVAETPEYIEAMEIVQRASRVR